MKKIAIELEASCTPTPTLAFNIVDEEESDSIYSTLQLASTNKVNLNVETNNSKCHV